MTATQIMTATCCDFSEEMRGTFTAKEIVANASIPSRRPKYMSEYTACPKLHKRDTSNEVKLT